MQAKYIARFLRPDRKQIDAGFVAHPSFLELQEVKEIRGPLSLACAGKMSSPAMIRRNR
jgi:hypothetical protein